jgi:3-oxoadipate enol-lactonase
MERIRALPVDPQDAPDLPRGRYVDLPGRGTTFVRESGPRTAPTVMLLHGLGATAAVNWFPAFRTLARSFHVVALDHRGHGRGIRDDKTFTLEDAADDAVALADALGIDQFIAAGYSMGGPIAQLIWRRRPERVSGLVLCATASTFCRSPRERLMFASLPLVECANRVVPDAVATGIVACLSVPYLAGRSYAAWVRSELVSVYQRTTLQAAGALGRYSTGPWIREIDVPTAVIVHSRDHVVPPSRQLALAARIPDATTYVIDADHFAPVREPEEFARVLVAAVNGVARHRTRASLAIAS